MGETLVEKIVLEVSSPTPNLAGLGSLVEQLQAVDRYLALINQRVGGLTTNSAMKRSAAQFTNLAESAGKGKRKRDDLADFFGFEKKDVEAFASNMNETLRKKFFESGQTFKNLGGAGQFFKQYSDKLLQEHGETVNALRGIFTGGSGGPAPSATPKGSSVAAAGAGQGIVLEVPGSMVRAVLVGEVTLNVPAGSVVGAEKVGHLSPALSPSDAERGKTGASPYRGGAHEPATGEGEIRRRIERTEKGAKTAITNALGPLDTITKVFDETGKELKSVTDLKPLDKVKRRIQEQVKLEGEAAKQALSGGFTGNKAGDLRTKAAVFEKTSANLEALAKQHETELKAAGAESVTIALRAKAQTLGAQAQAARKQAGLALAQEQAKDAKAQAAILKEAQANQERQAKEQKAAGEAHIKALDLAAKSRAANLGAAAGQAQFDDMLKNQGYAVVSAATGKRISAKDGVRDTRSVTIAKDEGNERLSRTFRFESDSSGKVMEVRMGELNKAVKAAGDSAQRAGKDFLQNTAHVTTWAASVAVLYGALGIAQRSLAGLVSTGYQTARLGQVFSGLGGTAADLRDSVLSLAAANGRSADEAMEAATAWSRLGLTKGQVLEGVRVSLMAANVAEVTSLEATKALQGIMASYGLQVTQLGSVLGELNAISNTYNVTNADMLAGISKAGSVAKQAGLPLAELAGYIGAVVGATGQTGSAVGNMLKSLGTGLGSPETQKRLRKDYDIEVRTESGGDIKNMSQVLDQLYVSYQKLTDAERQHLLYQVAGKTQSTRVAALLDSYVRAQVLAINAQLSLNSAEKENVAIKSTLKAQLQGVATEWDRLVAKQGDRGFLRGATAVTEAFRNTLSLLNAPGVSQAATLFGGLLAAMAARALVVGLQMQTAAGSAGFFANTLLKGRGALLATSTAMRAAFVDSIALNRGLMTMDVVTRKLVISIFAFGRSITAATAGTSLAGMGAMMGNLVKGAAGGLAVLRNFAVPLAVISGGIMAFNYGMEAIGRSSETADRALAGFNEEADRAAAAAGAAADAAKLFANAQKALGNMRPADRRRLGADLEDVGKIAGGGKDSMGFTEAQGKEFRAAVETGDMIKQNTMLQERYVNAVRRGMEERQAEFEGLQKGEAILQAELARLQGKWFPSPAEIAKKERELAEMRGKMTRHKIQSWEEVQDTRDANSAIDLQHQINLAKQKSLLESIVEIYKEMPAANPLERTKNEIAGIEEAIKANQRWQAELKKEAAAGFASDAAKDKEVERIEKVIEAKRRELSAAEEVADSATTFAPVEATWAYGPEAIKDTKGREKALREIAEFEAKKKATAEMKYPDYTHNRESKEKAEKQEEEQKKSLAAAKERLAMDRERSRREIAFEMAKGQSGQFDFGDNSTEKLLNRETGLKRLITGKQRVLDSGLGTEAEKHNLVVQLLQHETELYQVKIDKALEHYQISKEEAQLLKDKTREFQRSLLTAGPAEMLRKLAAHSLTQGGRLNAGSFFAMDPSMRQEVLNQPNFSPEMADIRRRRRMLSAASGPSGHYEMEASETDKERDARLKKNQEMADERAGYVNRLANFVQKAKPGELVDLRNPTTGKLTEFTYDKALERFQSQLKDFDSDPENKPIGPKMRRVWRHYSPLEQVQAGVDSHTTMMDKLRQQMGGGPMGGNAAAQAAAELAALGNAANGATTMLAKLATSVGAVQLAIEQLRTGMGGGAKGMNPQAAGHAPGRR